MAPDLAAGDFIDDLAPYYAALLNLQEFREAAFRLQIAGGHPGPEEFCLPRQMLALVAALGADLIVTTSTPPAGPAPAH